VRAGGNTGLPEQHFLPIKRNIKSSHAALHVLKLWGHSYGHYTMSPIRFAENRYLQKNKDTDDYKCA
jgi:hypothetical protein